MRRLITATFGKNLIDYPSDRRICFNATCVPWEVFFRCMQMHHQFSFDWLSSKLVFRPFHQPCAERVGVDFKNENAIEKPRELPRICRVSAKE